MFIRMQNQKLLDLFCSLGQGVFSELSKTRGFVETRNHEFPDWPSHTCEKTSEFAGDSPRTVITFRNLERRTRFHERGKTERDQREQDVSPLLCQKK